MHVGQGAEKILFLFLLRNSLIIYGDIEANAFS